MNESKKTKTTKIEKRKSVSLKTGIRAGRTKPEFTQDLIVFYPIEEGEV